MFWDVIKRLVDLTYLLLGLVMMAVLFSSVVQNQSTLDFEGSLKSFQEQVGKTISTNLEYAETRINRLARTQDDFQNSTSARMDILEGKVKAFETENKALKSQQKVIQNNLNLNTQNN